MFLFNKERKKEKKKIVSFKIVDKIVENIFSSSKQNKKQNTIFTADISHSFFESPFFKITLDTARTYRFPCFFIIDDTLQLPEYWDKDLNIVYIDYYKSLDQQSALENKMMSEVDNYVIENNSRI